MITIKNLCKHYGSQEVLRGINLEFRKGLITAIMGPNGSGKTTLLKSILGLVKPDSGFIYVNNSCINGNSEYRKFIGYMPQNACFPDNLKVGEIFEMLKNIRDGLSKHDEELIESLRLESIYEKPFGSLSSGTKQRVGGASAFLFDPEIIILDEPTAGLDPLSSEIFKEKIISESAKGKLVIITSHIVSEVEALADRIIFLLEGKVKIDSSAKEIIKDSGEENLSKAITAIVQRKAHAENS